MHSIAMVVNNFEINGVNKVVENYCTHLDSQKFNVTIMAGEPVNTLLVDSCIKHGAEVVVLPNRKRNPLEYYRALRRNLRKRKIDIIHVHGSSATILPEIFIGLICGIKHRIAHSHSTRGAHYSHYIFRPILGVLCTEALACSYDAGKWMFGKRKYQVIHNGVIIDHFRFNESNREDVRNKLCITEEFVIGHVGRMNHSKNQEFLIRVFEQYAATHDSSRLLIVGTGPDEDTIKQIVRDSKYKDRIVLYGETNDVNRVYSAMDIFVFPSMHEGLPITLIEAQINGLQCLVSDVITDEVLVGDTYKKLSLEAGAHKWAEEISDYEFKYNKSNRVFFSNELCCFDNDSVINQLEDIYMRMIETVR